MWTTLLVSLAFAAEPIDPFEERDESELFRFDEQLVTVASRYAQTVDKAPSIVSLIDAEQIRERGYRTLTDLLRDLPGIYTWKSPEGRDLVSFRGVLAPDNNKILLLVDGVPWYDGVYTHAFVDDYLPIAHVKQVEVIKGPGSAIYGTNAFAGVINVVTYSGADLQGAQVRVSGGSGGRGEVTVTGGGTETIGDLQASMVGYARMLGQDGIGINLNPDGSRNVLGEDPKRGMAAGARLEIGGLKAQVHHVDYRHTYLTRQSADNGLSQLSTDIDTNGIMYHDTFFDLRYAAKIGRALTITPNLWSQRHDNPGTYWFATGVSGTSTEGEVEGSFNSTIVETEKDSRRWGTGADVDWVPGINHHTVAGVGFEQTSVRQLADFEYNAENPDGVFTGFGLEDPDRNPTTGPYPRICSGFAYAQHSYIAAPGVEFVAGGRLDRRFACSPGFEPAAEALKIAASPRAAILLVPSERITIKLLYGEAFRYATVRELLVESPLDEDGRYDYTNGNRELAPERIRTAEGEIHATLAEGFTLRADASYSHVLREINVVDTPLGSAYGNIDDGLDIFGGEAEFIAKADLIEFRAAYAFTLAQYSGDGEIAGRQQYEFPMHMVKGDLTVRATDHLSANLGTEFYGPRERSDWSPDANMEDGPLFALLHLTVRAKDLGPQGRVSVDATIRNLTDTVYETPAYRDDANTANADGEPRYALGIAGQPRTVEVGINFRI